MDAKLNSLSTISDIENAYILCQYAHEDKFRSLTLFEFFNWLSLRIDVNSELIDPIAPGTETNPAVIPAGPAGQKRKFEPQPGFYQGFPEVTSDKRWQFYWDGISWELFDMGALPEVDTTSLLDKQTDGFKLLAQRVITPRFDIGHFIGVSDNSYQENSSLKLNIFEINPKTVKKVRIQGEIHLSSSYYYAEFKGDFTLSGNFAKGLNLSSGTLTAIDQWVDINEDTTYILTLSYIPTEGREVLVTDIESYKYLSEGEVSFVSPSNKQLIIGVDDPIVISDKYVNGSGDLADNPSELVSFWVKYYEIVPGSISHVRVVGTVNYSAVAWMSQFTALPIEAANLITRNKQSSTGEVPIDEWIPVDQSTKIIALSNDTNRNLTIVEIRATPQSLGTVSAKVDYSQISDLGAIEFQNIGEADINVVMGTGQSLMANNSPAVGVTTVAFLGNFMFGPAPTVLGNALLDSVNPLASIPGQGEIPLISGVNHFSKLWRRYRNPSTEFYANSVARGSRSIEALSKNCTNTSVFEAGENLYTTRLLNFLIRSKAYADANSKSISMSAFIWMQGESNYSGAGQGLTDGTNQTRDKNEYKALLLQYKNDVQADVMNIYGQPSKPLMFIYQTGRVWNDQVEQNITMAQIEFAQENEDVILINPVYFAPGMQPTSDHMSDNGARWYGELLGKALFEAFIKGSRASVVVGKAVSVIDSRTINVQFKVPVQPLIIDTHFSKQVSNAGFYVTNNIGSMSIQSISVVGGDTVQIKLVNPLTVGTVEVSYAGGQTTGRGNVRDSDTYGSMYMYTDYTAIESAPEEYVSRDSSGALMYGQKYPLHNWASHYYSSIAYSPA
ncbi:hypothetical protein HP439_11395 [Sphingobacterium shayense]|uniref:hypothetical protein n=1 Tax=Sphingobacterium shayense TaxID=626343 RepID=UPI0015578714|nr:hypothetical protein [Sphingobacterium shayense]NQD71325.1 hypothetical protein [Sphingobacterium shayense]